MSTSPISAFWNRSIRRKGKLKRPGEPGRFSFKKCQRRTLGRAVRREYHSTVTLLARFRGLSMSHPRCSAGPKKLHFSGTPHFTQTARQSPPVSRVRLKAGEPLDAPSGANIIPPLRSWQGSAAYQCRIRAAALRNRQTAAAAPRPETAEGWDGSAECR